MREWVGRADIQCLLLSVVRSHTIVVGAIAMVVVIVFVASSLAPRRRSSVSVSGAVVTQGNAVYRAPRGTVIEELGSTHIKGNCLIEATDGGRVSLGDVRVDGVMDVHVAGGGKCTLRSFAQGGAPAACPAGYECGR